MEAPIWLLELGLKGLGIGKSLMGVAGKALRWLFSDWHRVVIAGLVLSLAVSLWHAHHLAHDRDAWKAASAKWQSAERAWEGSERRLVHDVQAARAAAASADRANVARVAREYQQVNERTVRDLEARNADTHAAADQLRHRLAQVADGDRGDERRAVVPEALTARCQAFGAADCDALLASLPGQLTAAEDNTTTLLELQDYVRSTLLIDVNGTQPKPEGQ
jgi:hypothetical protein